MNVCLFDLKNQKCAAMIINGKQKENYCHHCKARVEEEYMLLQRYYDIIKRSKNNISNMASVKEELNSILGRKVAFMKLKVNQEKFNQLLLESAIDRKKLAISTMLSYGTINNMANGGITSLDSAKKVSDILGVKVADLFANIKM